MRMGYDGRSHLTSLQAPATPDQPGGTAQAWDYTPGTHVGDGVWDGTDPAVGGGVQPPGLQSVVTDAEGRVTRNSYDATGDLRRVVLPSGLTTTYAYDELGRKVSETVVDTTAGAATEATTTFVHDALGNVVQTTGQPVVNEVSGQTHRLRTVTTHDANGNVVRVDHLDVAGSDPTRTTTTGVDALDRVVSVTDPEGGTTTRTYTADNHVETVTDAEGRVVRTAYTDDGLPRRTVLQNFSDGLGGTQRTVELERREYDAGGRVTSTTDANGNERTYSYDGADGLVSTTLLRPGSPDGDLVLETRAYDGAGQLVETVTGGGLLRRTQTWDAAGRVESATIDPGGLNRTITWSYDAVGNVLTQASSQDGRTERVSTTYDPTNRPRTTTVENGSDDLVTTYTYDERGNRLSATDANGNTTSTTYDVLDRPVRRTLPQASVEDVGGDARTTTSQLQVGYDTFGATTHTEDARGNLTDGRHRPARP